MPMAWYWYLVLIVAVFNAGFISGTTWLMRKRDMPPGVVSHVTVEERRFLALS
jgi:hypothetical protein